MTNVINRLQLDLHFSQQEEAFGVRHNFAQTFQVQIEEVVDRVCSKYVSKDEWLKIDKLEIDLGQFGSNSFRHNFAGAFLYHFEKSLTEKLAGISLPERETSCEVSKVEVLEYFLQHGTLPWFANEEDTDIDKISLEIATNELKVLKNFLYKNRYNANLWKRVSYQLPDEVKALIFDMFEELKDAAEKAATVLRQFFISNPQLSIADRQIMYHSIRNVLLADPIGIFKNSPGLDSVREVLVKHTSLIFNENAAAASAFFETVKLHEDIGKTQTADINKGNTKPGNKSRYLPDEPFKNWEDEEERWMVRHAGILLLSPFFQSFFLRLRLINGIEWVSREAQYKGVHLLKFLSTGQLQPPEFMLTLEKIFCGLAIEEPVPAQVELTEDDLREAGDLLESVIEHWKVLKNTSVNGLREAFLKRDGIINRNDNGWLLRVERKTHDVLLDSIPWGYSTISLPWCHQMVFVEW